MSPNYCGCGLTAITMKLFIQVVDTSYMYIWLLIDNIYKHFLVINNYDNYYNYALVVNYSLAD